MGAGEAELHKDIAEVAGRTFLGVLCYLFLLLWQYKCWSKTLPALAQLSAGDVFIRGWKGVDPPDYVLSLMSVARRHHGWGV